MEKDSLMHFGIKGMRWGVRRYQNKDGSLTPAGKVRYSENYSEQQRIRDRKLYGERAVQRINKRMLNGEGIQSARHNEVVRKERISSGKQIAKNVTKGALVIGGAAAVATVLQKKGIGDKIAQGIMTEQIINVGRSFINGIFK